MKAADIIKYEGDNNTFIWKHPIEDFNTTTQLIVHESQEAIFFLNGEALDLFGPGSHTLETQNIPFIKRLLNIPTGNVTPFHCEVYYINKTEQMGIKWGTDSKVQFIEPAYKFPLSLGASGELSLYVNDSRKLLLKIVGTENVLNQETLLRFFRAFLMARVKTYIAQTVREQQINIFEIDERLVSLSDALKEKLNKDFDDYGMSLRQFFVTTIVKPDGEANYEKFKDLYYRQYGDVAEAQLRQKVGIIDKTTQQKQTIIEAEGIAQKRQIEGYSYQQERSFNVAEKAASNEGAGNFSAAGIGLGIMGSVGSSVGGQIGSTINNAVKPINETSIKTKFCSSCGQSLPENAVFCGNCGSKAAAQNKCSACNFVFDRPSKFCPQCGKKQEDIPNDK
jgi:membrane protease subunit (stomatin/prohibitin family)